MTSTAAKARFAELVAREEPLCLLCAEENPALCHRKTLITPDLIAMGLRVRHIRSLIL
jgi:uncharacterized protein (DUF488 family)